MTKYACGPCKCSDPARLTGKDMIPVKCVYSRHYSYVKRYVQHQRHQKHTDPPDAMTPIVLPTTSILFDSTAARATAPLQSKHMHMQNTHVHVRNKPWHRLQRNDGNTATVNCCSAGNENSATPWFKDDLKCFECNFHRVSHLDMHPHASTDSLVSDRQERWPYYSPPCSYTSR